MLQVSIKINLPTCVGVNKDLHCLQMLVHSPEEVPLVMDFGSHIAAGEGAIISVAKEEVRTFSTLLHTI